MDYLRQLENKVLGNLKQTTEKDIMGCMGEHKYVKGEMRGVNLWLKMKSPKRHKEEEFEKSFTEE